MADVSRLLETLHPMREPPLPSSIAPYLVMAGLGCLAAVIGAAVWIAIRRRADVRRSAEAALAASRMLAPAERLAAQAVLLRRLVRGLAGEEAVRKQGRAWLESLDRTFETRFFTHDAGKVFGDGIYSQRAVPDVDALERSLSGLIAGLRLTGVRKGRA